MANDVKEKTERKFHWRLFIFLIVMFVIFVAAIYDYWKETHQEGGQENHSSLVIFDEEEETQNATANQTEGVLYLHMIDCGQGDSFLFEQDGQYGLIDCGTRSTGKDVVEYLKQEGVQELQFVMGTHQHDDHMGGMYDVIDNFKCDVIYMPKIETDLVTTNWYIKLVTRIKEDKITIINPKEDDKFYLGDAVFTVVGQPTSKEAEKNVNNYSTIVKVSFGEMDILMTGDSETKIEERIVKEKRSELQCEILKLGHHGSNTSTSDDFLDAVSPDYGLISCGVGNKYNHPCKETMEKLEKNKVKIYRTDEEGSVVATISNNSVSFDKKQGDYADGTTLANN